MNRSLSSDRPTLVEVNRSALRANYTVLKGLVGAPEIMAVIKADAYGHGAVEVARVLCAQGCRHLGVATIQEAGALRAAGIDAKVYLMGGFFDGQAADIIDLGLTPFVFESSAIASLEQAAGARGCLNFPIHLKLDTGATRLGIRFEQLDRAVEELRAAASLRLEGVCTLLADAGNPASSVTSEQLELFRRAVGRLNEAGLRPELIHAANSAAAILRPDSHFNLVRVGLALYGLAPTPAVQERVVLQPVMTFKTRLLQVKSVAAGAGVSYGRTFLTTRPSVIGVLPVGYADGYRRGLQHGAEVMVGGQRAPVVGAICMDLTMIDLTGVANAAVGDEVILWGGSGRDVISVNEIARLAQTISYEMLCTVGKRVPRLYVG